MKFRAIPSKDQRFAIGLSAGTSCHAIQAALVRIRGTGESLHLKLIRCESYPLRQAFQARLLTPRPDAREIALLNFELGELLADAALDMIRTAQEEMYETHFVGIQGHGLFHLPPRGSDAYGLLRIGEPAVVAERTVLPVVSDFAARDMAAGGQGAPVGAYADWVLFARPDRTVACLHLGGLSSITVVTPRVENVLAFDIGPGTLAIDGAVRFVTAGAAELDENGEMGEQGTVIDELLERLLDHRYFERVPPKSSGKHEFGPDAYLRDVLDEFRHRPPNDIVATVTAAVAENIIRSFKRFISPQYRINRMVVSGGGVNNRCLLQRLQQGIDATFRTSEQYGLPIQGCDGIAAAILGNETLCGTPANTPKATGVRYPVILGKITPN
jgi:anhydro-N-acetylmuramic acid kinase